MGRFITGLDISSEFYYRGVEAGTQALSNEIFRLLTEESVARKFIEKMYPGINKNIIEKYLKKEEIKKLAEKYIARLKNQILQEMPVHRYMCIENQIDVGDGMKAMLRYSASLVSGEVIVYIQGYNPHAKKGEYESFVYKTFGYLTFKYGGNGEVIPDVSKYYLEAKCKK